MSQGALFRRIIQENNPLPILGVINAYAALLAGEAGAKVIYLSGAGVANTCFGLPDLAITTLTDLCQEASKITSASSLPLLVDIDTGFGSVLNIRRTIQLLESIGVAAVHIEDQVFEKRCGHLDGKQLVSPQIMQSRIKAAVDARIDENFVIMARTDALAIESKQATLDRILNYIEAGADMIFLEAVRDLKTLVEMRQFISVPILINSTEFGKTPIYSQSQWAQHGADMVLYPLSAFRVMSKACLEAYQTILQTGTQETLLDKMQTRQSLYEVLHYKDYQQLLALGEACE